MKLFISFTIGILFSVVIVAINNSYSFHKEFDKRYQPYLDTIRNQGFEVGKIAAIYGTVKVLDSINKLPRPLDLRRAIQIADSIYTKSYKIVLE